MPDRRPLIRRQKGATSLKESVDDGDGDGGG